MKRYYVIPYLIGLVVVVIFALWQAVTVSAIWLLAVIACGPMLLFMSALVLRQQSRTRAHLYPELALAVIAAVAALIFSAAWVLVALCLLFGVIGILLYDFWYSRLGRAEQGVLRTGECLPDFPLYDTEGVVFTADSLRGKKTVWMFIRGNWCPLCVAQVKELAACYQQLHDMGAQVVVVTPQPAEDTRKMAERFQVPLIFAVDKESQASRQLGLLHAGGVPAGISGYGADTVYPTVLITDEKGKLLYSDQTDNYRLRPEPEEFLRVLSST